MNTITLERVEIQPRALKPDHHHKNCGSGLNFNSIRAFMTSCQVLKRKAVSQCVRELSCTRTDRQRSLPRLSRFDCSCSFKRTLRVRHSTSQDVTLRRAEDYGSAHIPGYRLFDSEHQVDKFLRGKVKKYLKLNSPFSYSKTITAFVIISIPIRKRT